QARCVAVDNRARWRATAVRSGSTFLQDAVGERRIFPDLQTNAGESETAESDDRVGASRSRRIAVGGATAAGARHVCAGGAAQDAGDVQRPAGIAGDPRRNRGAVGATATGDVLASA